MDKQATRKRGLPPRSVLLLPLSLPPHLHPHSQLQLGGMDQLTASGFSPLANQTAVLGEEKEGHEVGTEMSEPARLRRVTGRGHKGQKDLWPPRQRRVGCRGGEEEQECELCASLADRGKGQRQGAAGCGPAST